MNPPPTIPVPPKAGARGFSKTALRLPEAVKRALLQARVSKAMDQAFANANALQAASLIDAYAVKGPEGAGIGGWDQGLRWRRAFVRHLRGSGHSIQMMAPRMIELARTPEGLYFAMTAACEAASQRGRGGEREWVELATQSIRALSNRWQFFCGRTPSSTVWVDPGTIHANLDKAWQTPLNLQEIWAQSSRLFALDRGALAIGMSVEHLLSSMLRKQWERLPPGGMEAIKAEISNTPADFLNHLLYILQRCVFPGYAMRQALEPWLEGLLAVRAEEALFDAVLTRETAGARARNTTLHRL